MLYRGPAFLGFPNIISKDYCTVTTTGFSGLEPTDMVGSYLKTEEPSDAARLTMLDPKHSQWVFKFSGIVHDFNGFALINHNIVEGGHYRILGFLSEVTPFVYNTQAANVIASSSNSTGVIGNIDELIEAPDGLVIEPTANGLPWDIRLSFANLSPLPKTGSGGFFVLRMRRMFFGSGAANPITLPMVTVDLYENGSLVRSLGYRPITETAAGGQVLIFPFDFSELALPNGNNIECKITVTQGTSTVDNQYAVLESLRLYYEEVPIAAFFDSGWLEASGKDDESPTVSNHFFPSDLLWEDLKSVVLLIRSDQVTKSAPIANSIGLIPYLSVDLTPPTYIDLGVFSGGTAQFLSMAIGHKTGPSSKILITSIESGISLAGQSYSSDLFRRRSVSPIQITVTRDELLFLQNEIAWKKGRSSPFYVSLEPDISLDYQKFISFWATLTELGEPVELVGNEPGSNMVFSVSIGLEEKL